MDVEVRYEFDTKRERDDMTLRKMESRRVDRQLAKIFSRGGLTL